MLKGVRSFRRSCQGVPWLVMRYFEGEAVPHAD